MGYHRAGFDVVGVDNRPQPHYPFTFIRGDAMEWLKGPLFLDFDAIHASPPCQPYSPSVRTADSPYTPSRGNNEPALIGSTRQHLASAGVPWVIENVYGARTELNASLMLCGAMFDLPVRRHRLFESSEYLFSPPHNCGELPRIRERYPVPAHWHTRPTGAHLDRAYSVTGKSRGSGCIPFWRDCMGMPWAETAYELSEAIPPAYTEWIGRQLLAVLK
jgi:hypothetical protein